MTTRKVAYNTAYGGFCLSKQAVDLGRELSGDPEWCLYRGFYYGSRHDPILIKVLETFGEDASHCKGAIQITEVEGPYRIDEYDGREAVTTPKNYDWH